ncbi:MAG: hypothetical protein J6K25_14480 [Thermoguttaceae bacterium]|nr:hypothetical protein [Thermoguttaceae bacterium]
MSENDIRNNNDDVRNNNNEATNNQNNAVCNNNNEATNNQNNAAANENFQIRPNMAWTDEQIEAIWGIARNSVDRFADNFGAITQERTQRIETIVRDVLRNNKKHPLRNTLTARIKAVLDASVRNYANENWNNRITIEQIEGLRTLTNNVVDH